MWAEYRCGTEARRLAVAASQVEVDGLALNGIDFVEVQVDGGEWTRA